MKLEDFIKEYGDKPVIDSSGFSAHESPESLRRQVSRWVKKGYLFPLKRGLYVLSDFYRKKDLPLGFVANLLVVPSYVSLTYTLSYYEVIPEKATVVTSITTKKTRRFDNNMGRFEYHSVKQELFRGYTTEEVLDQDVFIATPEKALVDYFYFNAERNPQEDYFDSLRLQNLEIMNRDALASYLERYNARVDSVIMNFIDYYEKREQRYKRL